MVGKRLTFCILACLSASMLLAQNLEDAARKERERRKKNADAGVKAPKFGEAELRSATAGKGTFSNSGTLPQSDAPAQGASETALQPGRVIASSTEVGPDGDRAKRQLAAQLKSSLSQAEARLTRAEAGLKAAEDHWAFVNSHTNDSYPLDEARRTLESAKAAADRARQQRDEIEDRARREGIPPGWIR